MLQLPCSPVLVCEIYQQALIPTSLELGLFLCDAESSVPVQLVYVATIIRPDPKPNLWFVPEEGLVNLHNDARPTRDGRCLQLLCGTQFPQPLVNINGCMFVDLCLIHGICHRTVPGPQVKQEQPLLEGKLRFRKNVSFSYGFSCVALSTPPTVPVGDIMSWPLIHMNSTSKIIIILTIDYNVISMKILLLNLIVSGILVCEHCYVKAANLCSHRMRPASACSSKN